MTFKCRKCGIEFWMPDRMERYPNWHGAVASDALSKHGELMPECADPYLDTTNPA